MQGLRAWLAAHKLSAKALLVYWPTLVAFWSVSKEFRDYVWWLYAFTPNWMHRLIVGVVVPALAFWRVQCNRRESGQGDAKE